MTKQFEKQLTEELEKIQISLSDEKCLKFYQYYELLIEWNQVMNLTTTVEIEEVVTKHFVDSLSLIKTVKDLAVKDYSVIDIGAGAGFPGIPLKIVFPNLKIMLIDSSNKKVNFINEIISILELKDVMAIHGRAEDFGQDRKYREQYDICVSRAVANISTLAEYCMPFVCKGGYFIPYKSGKLEQELIIGRNAISKLSGEIEEIVTFQLTNTDKRSLVKIKKIGLTNKKYPRKAGLPAKEPLC